MNEFSALRNQPRYEEKRDANGVLISRTLITESAQVKCTIPCDGTGWTGNPRERCLTHYEL